MMKKIFSILLLFSAMTLILTSCDMASPGAACKSYMEKLKNGDYKGFAQGIATDETKTAEENEQMVAMIEGLLKEKSDQMLKEKGGIKDIKILEENVSEDGNTATVKVKFIYGDGTEKEDTQEMVKQNGVWKMHIKK